MTPSPWYRNWRFWLLMVAVWFVLKMMVPPDQQHLAYEWLGVDPPAQAR